MNKTNKLSLVDQVGRSKMEEGTLSRGWVRLDDLKG